MVSVCLGMCMYGYASKCDECRTMSACVSVCVAMYSVIEWVCRMTNVVCTHSPSGCDEV